MAYKKITPELFAGIKRMLTHGATQADVHMVYGVSTHTCKRIMDARDYADYERIVKEFSAKVAQKKATPNPVTEQPKPAPVTATPVNINMPWQMIQEMQKTNELLKLISNKLAYIVEQLA